MSNTAFKDGINVLQRVFYEGAYVSQALKQVPEASRPQAAQIVYGVLENYYLLNFTVEAVTVRAPKPIVKLILLQGIYALKNMNMPDYAVVNESVDLAKAVAYPEDCGFVNAVLKRVARGDYEVDLHGDREIEAQFNLPAWIVKRVKAQYPKAYRKMLSPERALHVRLKSGVSENVLSQEKVLKTTLTGYYVEPSATLDKLFYEGKLTYQGKDSTYAVLALGDVQGKRVLDCCAAPGGKSVFAAERGGIVTAEDIHAHRVELIKTYAARMRVNVNAKVGDATSFNAEYADAFDAVLVDAPCSGLGVMAKNKDTFLHRTQNDIKSLSDLQKAILDNASRYVKHGGVLVYSTCTVLKEENHFRVAEFLREHPDFRLSAIDGVPYAESGEIQMVKTDRFSDGFYIARMVCK